MCWSVQHCAYTASVSVWVNACVCLVFLTDWPSQPPMEGMEGTCRGIKAWGGGGRGKGGICATHRRAHLMYGPFY